MKNAERTVGMSRYCRGFKHGMHTPCSLAGCLYYSDVMVNGKIRSPENNLTGRKIPNLNSNCSTESRPADPVSYSTPEKTLLIRGESDPTTRIHEQCRTKHKWSTKRPEPSITRGLSRFRYISLNSHLIQRHLFSSSISPLGLLHGINIKIRNCHFGVIRIICLTLLILYLCLPTSFAAPRQKFRQLERNQSQAAELDELVGLVRREQGLPPPTRKESTLRKAGRTGRSGRRRQAESTSPTGEETYLKIKEEFLNASCKPRDTILDAFHELNIDRGYQTLFPECVVVQRCKNGGCCLEHQECTSISSEYKTFYFLLDTYTPLTKSIRQDTACECVEKQPFCGVTQANCSNEKVLNLNTCSCECPIKCPQPFLQNENCECDCLMSDRPCKNFFRGKKGIKLSDQDCSCVSHRECLVPPCANGYFSQRHCRCINSSNSKR